jgi:hypothetical protein
MKVMAIKIINIMDAVNMQHWLDELIHAMQSNGPLHQVDNDKFATMPSIMHRHNNCLKNFEQ